MSKKSTILFYVNMLHIGGMETFLHRHIAFFWSRLNRIAVASNVWADSDGETQRIVWCWKLFLPHFKVSRCSKYSLEELRLQIQLQVLSPNLAHQLRRHRFVNTRGGMVHVIFEHVNKLVKTFIQECEV